MASTSTSEGESIGVNDIRELKGLMWGNDIKHDVFRRWTQGFVFSEDEPTALLQLEGGPCAVIAPLQAFLMKNIFFTDSSEKKENWNNVTDDERDKLLGAAFGDILDMVKSTDFFMMMYHESKIDPNSGSEDINATENENENEEGESSPKKRRFSHEQFHEGLRCFKCRTREALHKFLEDNISYYKNHYGVLLFLYSVILSKGIDQIKNEVEDPGEALIDGTYGHGSQSLINMMLTGKAISNVWDNDKDVSGLKLRGINQQATIGFLTLLEHLRYCEVGWYLKNPEFPIWLLGSETHLTVLFSQEKNLVSPESSEGAARRIFNSYDTEGSGFVTATLLGDLMAALDLVSEPEYVKIMQDKLDPEQLGIITLNSFMDEFFPSENTADQLQTFTIFHYNGLQRSCQDHKVVYQEANAVIMEMPELQIITDSSPIKTCLMTKWPTIELKWKSNTIPSIN